MNVGTAQRITLNLLSTLVMIRLGRVYRGLMVDMQSANVKLGKRKRAMVAYLTGRSEEEAEGALKRADGHVKLAVLLLHGCEIEVAAEALRRAGGNPDRKSFMQAMEAERLDGPGHYRIHFGAGKRVGTQYVNFVMISDKGRIVD